MTVYLLDTNVFIQAKNHHYGFEFCPAFWDWLVVQNGAGMVMSIKEVANELLAGKDELAKWAKEQGEDFFLVPDEAVVDEFRIVSDWANGNGFERAAIRTFLNGADSWLVAHARAHNCTVVTHEVRTNTINNIKIPNACSNLSLRCISPYEMLRRGRARFVFGPGREVA